jgi:L-lactate dehydrogenase complex protein LldG
MEREAFLARLSPAVTMPVFDAPDVPAVTIDGDLLDSWRSRAEALGVEIHEVSTSNDTRDLVRALAEERGVTDFCSWEDEHLPVHGIAGYLVTAGMAEHVVGAEEVASLEPVGLGVTSADGLLAETGSIVLSTGPGRSRFASLLPLLHVVVVARDRVRPSLRAVMDEVGVDTANTVVVTGPSRTGDIEGILVKGVHGPAEVHVILVP